MVLSELQKNSRTNLLRMIRDIASSERQREYKDKVPFVHVPIELLAQWDGYSRLIHEKRAWFVDIFTQDELSALIMFDVAVRDYERASDNDIKDVPEILQDEDWLALVARAKKLLSLVSESFE